MLLPCADATATQTVAFTRAVVTDPPGRPSRLSYDTVIAPAAGSVPSPLTHGDLLTPAGTRLDLRDSTTCARGVLETLGPDGCPPASRAGYGEGLTISRYGTKIVEQPFGLWLFLAEDRPGKPGLLFSLDEHEPFSLDETFTGTVLAAGSPYGLDVSFDMPVVPVYPGVIPDAVTESLQITLGEDRGRGGGLGLTVPRSCPRGGWALAAGFVFQDGTSARSGRKAPCKGD